MGCGREKERDRCGAAEPNVDGMNRWVLDGGRDPRGIEHGLEVRPGNIRFEVGELPSIKVRVEHSPVVQFSASERKSAQLCGTEWLVFILKRS